MLRRSGRAEASPPCSGFRLRPGRGRGGTGGPRRHAGETRGRRGHVKRWTGTAAADRCKIRMQGTKWRARPVRFRVAASGQGPARRTAGGRHAGGQGRAVRRLRPQGRAAARGKGNREFVPGRGGTGTADPRAKRSRLVGTGGSPRQRCPQVNVRAGGQGRTRRRESPGRRASGNLRRGRPPPRGVQLDAGGLRWPAGGFPVRAGTLFGVYAGPAAAEASQQVRILFRKTARPVAIEAGQGRERGSGAIAGNVTRHDAVSWQLGIRRTGTAAIAGKAARAPLRCYAVIPIGT
jgi:hypothetical protein